jgi:hypothetical protein
LDLQELKKKGVMATIDCIVIESYHVHKILFPLFQPTSHTPTPRRKAPNSNPNRRTPFTGSLDRTKQILKKEKEQGKERWNEV